MERLTKRSENGTGIYIAPSEEPTKWENNRHGVLQKLADYEDTGLEPEKIPTKEEVDRIIKYIEELKDYKDLEEQGLLIKLPCKVGDTVYLLTGDEYNPLAECVVSKLEIDKEYKILMILFYKDFAMTELKWSTEIGETVFLTREEAEKALEEFTNEME